MCPKCGFANQPGFQFCSNCGAPLAAAAAPPAGAPPAGYPPPYGTGPSPWDYERTKQVDRTRTGVLLLLIGTLIGWLPVIGLIGSLLLLIGAILVILGRKAFGPVHSRNVVLAIVFFFVGIIVTVVLVVGATLASLPGLSTGTQAQVEAALTAAVNNILIGGIVGAAITGLASVFFTYALQEKMGKMILWAAYAANIVLEIAIFAIVSPLISKAVSDAFAGGTFNEAPYLNLTAQITTLGYLTVIPALLYTAANYLAWSRIKGGVIPERPAAPAVPYGAPPPYMPPQAPPPGGAMPPSPPTSPP